MRRTSRLTWRTDTFSHAAASAWAIVRSMTCTITAYRSASFKLIAIASAMIAPISQRGHLNLVKRGHYGFALSVSPQHLDRRRQMEP